MSIHWFCKNIGVPVNLIAGDPLSQTSIKVKRLCDKVGTILNILENGTPWANIAELYIGIIKEAVCNDIHALHSPMVIWDYVIES